MKTKIRNIVILMSIAIASVLVLQISWLINNYKISREKARMDIKAILDDAMREHNEKIAVRFRTLLKQDIRSDTDFNYHILHWQSNGGVYHTGIELGITGKGPEPTRYAYAVYPIAAVDTTAVKKDPYAYLIKKINGFTLDELKPLYSALTYPETHNYWYKDSAKTKSLLKNQLKQLFNERVDSTLLKRILEKDFLSKGMGFKGTVKFYKNIVSFGAPASKFKPIPHDEQVQIVFESPYFKSYAQQLNTMHEYMDNLSQKNDSLYVEKFLQQNEKDILSSNSPGIIMAVKLPAILIVRQMALNIIASAVLLIFLGACIGYMFYMILQQKKLSDIKNDFISNISHELKTPIATTLAAVQGMQYFDVLKDGKKTERYLSTASNELNRLAVMVNKILNISIFESADFTLNPVEFNLKAMLEGIIAAQQIRQEKSIALIINYTASEMAFADKTHLYNVIINLIDNAIKYSANEVTISIDCINTPEGIQMSIQDNGPGVAQEFQKNVFDKFFRVPNPNDHSVKGYGLGLNYVKHIIEKHDGTVALKSSVTGSTFIINLPQNAAL